MPHMPKTRDIQFFFLVGILCLGGFYNVIATAGPLANHGPLPSRDGSCNAERVTTGPTVTTVQERVWPWPVAILR